MALVQFCGWESGNSNEATSTSGTFSVQSTIKRTGTYALRVNPTTSATGFQRFGPIEADGTNGDGFPGFANNIWARFYFYIATLPASGSEEIYSITSGTSGTRMCSIKLESTGALTVYDVDGSIGTSSTLLSTGVWNRIELKTGTSTTTADLILNINGVTEVQDLNSNTGAAGPGRIALGKVLDTTSESIDVYYDDFAVSDSDFPGAGQCSVMTPDANGSTMDWTSGTAADYTAVDEIPTNGADYVMSTGGGTGEVALFDFISTATAGISGTINAVKAVTRTRENTSVTSATSVRIRSGSTNSDSSGFNGSTSEATQSRLLAVDPDTAVAWTTSGLDAIEAGNVEANAVSTRCVSVLVMVDYVPTVVSSTFLPRMTLMGCG